MDRVFKATGLTSGNYSVIITDANGCLGYGNVSVGAGTQLIVASTVTDASCYQSSDGEVLLSPSGGTSPYQYLWDDGSTANSVTGLFAGNYDVTVIDANSCEASVLPITVEEPLGMNLTVTNGLVSCYGGTDGSLAVTVTGGASGYSYDWGNGQTTTVATGMPVGVGNITVTDQNMCDVAGSYTVTEPSQLSITLSGIDPLCENTCDGSVSVAVAGGNPTYSYDWDTGGTGSIVSGLCGGAVVVTVFDANGCSATDTIELNEPSALSITFQASDVTCPSGSDGVAVVVASGGNNASYSYQWGGGISSTNPFAANLSAGTYGLTVTDGNGCNIDTSNFVVNEPAVISVTSFAVLPSNCSMPDGAISVVSAIGGTGGTYTYQWDNGQTSFNAVGLLDGQYCVSVIDGLGCVGVSCVNVDMIPGPMAATMPSSTTCNGYCDGASIILVSPFPGGSTQFSYQWDSNTANQITPIATGLCAGTYDLTITDDNSCVTTLTTTISEPSLVSVSTSVLENPICYEQCTDITAMGSGGNGSPYSYVWDNGFQSTINVCLTQTTSFFVTVYDAAGCISGQGTAQIEVLPPLSVLAYGDDTICENDSVDIGVIISG